MAALSGKLVSTTEIKLNGNVFHQLLRDETHRISSLSPEKIQGVELVDGVWGTQGSIICWKYVFDGKAETCTEIIEEINEENKSIRFKVVAGGLLKQYKAFTFISKVDQIDLNTYAVTWTLEYEKLHEAITPPNAMMNFLISMTKDIENRYGQLQPRADQQCK
ncbi:kirola-like [Apium graveolens]